MVKNFLENFENVQLPYPDKVEGYTESEIEKLEELFDFSATGSLRDFLRVVGRCFGGILGDDALIPYRDHWSFKEHKRYQFGSREDLIEEGLGNYIGEGEFFFSSQSDGCFDYFVRTRSQTPDLVYQYDGDTIRATNYSFTYHIQNLVMYELEYLAKMQDVNSEVYQQALRFKASAPDYHWKHITGEKPLVFRGNMLP